MCSPTSQWRVLEGHKMEDEAATWTTIRTSHGKNTVKRNAGRLWCPSEWVAHPGTVSFGNASSPRGISSDPTPLMD